MVVRVTRVGHVVKSRVVQTSVEPRDSTEVARSVIGYAVVDDSLSPDFPLGDAVETIIRRDDAERFIEEVCGDDRELPEV